MIFAVCSLVAMAVVVVFAAWGYDKDLFGAPAVYGFMLLAVLVSMPGALRLERWDYERRSRRR